MALSQAIAQITSVLGAAALALVGFALSLAAGPQEDARYIVDLTVTEEVMGGAIHAQRPMIASALKHDFSTHGIEVSDMDRFIDVFMEEFLAGFMASMKGDFTQLYLENFSEGELAEIAAFYRTDAGQAMIAKTPALMMQGASIGRKHGMTAGRAAGPRVADRLEAEGVTITKDSSSFKQLLDHLRR